MWKKKYQPRYICFIGSWPLAHIFFFWSNHVPWAVISACIGACTVLILTLRFMLHFENKRREAEKRDDSYDDVYVTQELADGTKTEKRVDRVRCNFSTILLFLCVLPGIPWYYRYPEPRFPLRPVIPCTEFYIIYQHNNKSTTLNRPAFWQPYCFFQWQTLIQFPDNFSWYSWIYNFLEIPMVDLYCLQRLDARNLANSFALDQRSCIHYEQRFLVQQGRHKRERKWAG